MADLNPALVKQFLHVPLAEGEAVREPQSVADDAQGKTVAVGLPVSHRSPPYRRLVARTHAHAFAQHASASAWMRQHHPAAFLAGVLAEAPGMWPASTLGHEARRWGVKLAPMCINRSGISYRAESAQVVRAPLTAVDGLSPDAARGIVQERLTGGKFVGVEDFYDRVDLSRDTLETLVKAGAFDVQGPRPNRLQVFYALQTVAHARKPGTRALLGPQVQAPDLPDLCADETLWLDLETKGVSESGRHPLDAHRTRLRDVGCKPPEALRHGEQAWTAGLIVARQKPPTAGGFAFYVLEDGASRAQAVISPDLWEAHRVLLRDAQALIVCGEATVRGRAVTLRVLRLSELPLSHVRQAAD
ncbi:helix-hairpin-helix domain-containing protein [Deinococcus aetherius]|nr:hypothetical protein [Deinococcus aetherius]